jgi:type I restriction enzyme S subunit
MNLDTDVVRLGDVVELIKTKWVPRIDDVEKIELYSIPAFDGGSPEIVETQSVGSAKTLVEHSCVLLSKINPRIPRVWMVDGEGRFVRACSTEFLVLKPRIPQDLTYLYYVLKSSSFRRKLLTLTSGSSGSHQRVSAEDVLNIVVYWPKSFELRDEITWKLSLLDKKIDSNAEVQARLEDWLQARFQLLLTKGSEALKFVRRSRGEDVRTKWNEERQTLEPRLREELSEWKVGLLGDFHLVLESGRRPKGGVKWITDGVPSIGAESINGIGRFDWRTVKYVPRDFFESLKKGIPENFDVLLYKDGGQPGVFKPRLGMFGRGFPFEEWAINEHVFLLRSQELPPAFLYFWVAQDWVLDVLRDAGVKGAQPGINQSDVRGLPVVIPPKMDLNDFHKETEPILSMILDFANESRLLSLIRNSVGNELIPFVTAEGTNLEAK